MEGPEARRDGSPLSEQADRLGRELPEKSLLCQAPRAMMVPLSLGPGCESASWAGAFPMHKAQGEKRLSKKGDADPSTVLFCQPASGSVPPEPGRLYFIAPIPATLGKKLDSVVWHRDSKYFSAESLYTFIYPRKHLLTLSFHVRRTGMKQDRHPTGFSPGCSHRPPPGGSRRAVCHSLNRPLTGGSGEV